MGERKPKKAIRLSDRWHKLFRDNFIIKCVSLLGAVLVWVLIINVDNPYKTKKFLVSVETINEEALRSVHKVYEVVDGGVATVTVRAKRSIIDNLESSDIVATADLSELSAVNAVAVKARLRSGSSSDIELDCDDVLKVSLEEMEKKQVIVTVVTEGMPADGYTVGECVARPNVVEVTGGESVIDRIASVRVTMNVNGASENFSKKLEPVAYDNRGNKVVSSTLSFSEEKVKVHVRLLQNKSIPVKAEIQGEVAQGYEYVELECLPKEITIAGAIKVLKEISEITVPIDITGLTDKKADTEKEIDVREYLPDEIVIPEEYQKITIRLTIEELKEKSVELSVDRIKLENVEDGYVAAIEMQKDFVEVLVRGRKSVINAIPANAFSGTVNCKGLSEGVHWLTVRLDLESTCSLVREVKIKVVIKKQDVKEKETPGPTQNQEPETTKAPENIEDENTDEETPEKQE